MIIKKFNYMQPLDKELVDKITDYFEFRWKYHRNAGITNVHDFQNIVQQMPKFVLIRILKEFLFPEFLKTFDKTFKLPKPHPHIKAAYYNWSDDPYQSFMVDVLLSLEPRLELAEVTLMEENEDWLEVLFFTSGIYYVGFEIN